MQNKIRTKSLATNLVYEGGFWPVRVATIASRNRIWNFGQLAEKTVLSPTIEVIIKKKSMYFGDFREGNST